MAEKDFINTPSNTELQDRRVLITGASSGIGAATATLLASHGARIALGYCSSADQGHERARGIAASIRAHEGDLVVVDADVAVRTDVERLYAQSLASLQYLDAVIHCAAVVDDHPFTALTPQDYERVFATNVSGTLWVLQEAARNVVNGGRIIALSSPAARGGAPGGALYCASKAALEGFVRCLAWELGPRRITVNAVAPGPTDTPMLDAKWRNQAPARTPLGKLGHADDVAGVILLMLSEAAGWLTGQTIFAGGGSTMG